MTQSEAIDRMNKGTTVFVVTRNISGGKKETIMVTVGHIISVGRTTVRFKHDESLKSDTVLLSEVITNKNEVVNAVSRYMDLVQA